MASQRAAKPVHPASDLEEGKYTIREWNGIKLEIKKKFPLFGLLKALDESPIKAMSLVMSPDTLAVLETTDMDFDDVNELLDIMSEAMGLKNLGN